MPRTTRFAAIALAAAAFTGCAKQEAKAVPKATTSLAPTIQGKKPCYFPVLRLQPDGHTIIVEPTIGYNYYRYKIDVLSAAGVVQIEQDYPDNSQRIRKGNSLPLTGLEPGDESEPLKFPDRDDMITAFTLLINAGPDPHHNRVSFRASVCPDADKKAA